MKHISEIIIDILQKIDLRMNENIGYECNNVIEASAISTSTSTAIAIGRIIEDNS
jgi:hypothetical protein